MHERNREISNTRNSNGVRTGQLRATGLSTTTSKLAEMARRLQQRTQRQDDRGLQHDTVHEPVSGGTDDAVPEVQTNSEGGRTTAQGEQRSIDRRGINRNNPLDRFARQHELVTIRHRTTPAVVGIIGLGNIGSHVVLNLARVGVEVMHLYDSDRVALHNTASQAYTVKDIGKYKVEVMRDEIKRINEDIVVYIHSNIQFRKPQWVSDNDYLVIAVDTMELRKKIARTVGTHGERYPRRTKRIIDLRVGGEQVDIFNVSAVWHQNTIRENADDEPCGAEFVAYVSSMAGAIGAKEVIDCIHDETALLALRLPTTKSYAIDVRNMVIINEI